METEAIASAKAGEQIAIAREILRAFGVPPLRPTLIGTDNLANYKVVTGVGCPSRSRHFLRRYFVLKRRIASGEVTMVHVPDVQMPADCLTKWLPSDEVRRSVDYMTNRRAAPQATAAYSEITLNDIADAIANVSDHSHDGNLHDRAYQVWGSVVSEPVSTVRNLDLPLRPPLRACQGEGRSGGSASCPLLRLLTIGKDMAGPEHADLVPPPAFGFGAAHLRATAPAASQPRPQHRGGLDPGQPPTGQADNTLTSVFGIRVK